MPKATVGKRGLSVRHYKGTVFKLHEGHRDGSFLAYTYASSINQAGHFLGRRYPYPLYVVAEVKEAG